MPDKDDFFMDLLDDIEDDFEEEDEDLEEEDDEDEEESKSDDDKSKEKEKEEDDTEAKKAEEERRKNKNAEEARKRREREAKEAKAEKEKKAKEAELEEKLGKQLNEFKKKYPQIELSELDKDEKFKRYIEGKLLGRKDFTELYDEFIELRSELSGKTKEETQENYIRKAKASSGQIKSGGGTQTPSDIFSEDELRKIAEKLPYLPQKEVEKYEEKLKRSISYYESKK